MDDVTEENDEDEERYKEDKNRNTKVENFPPKICPARKVRHTFRLKERRHLRHPELNGEDENAGDGRKEGEDPGSGEEFVRRAVYREGLGDRTVSVKGDGHQHVVGRGQGIGLQKLEKIFIEPECVDLNPS